MWSLAYLGTLFLSHESILSLSVLGLSLVFLSSEVSSFSRISYLSHTIYRVPLIWYLETADNLKSEVLNLKLVFIMPL